MAQQSEYEYSRSESQNQQSQSQNYSQLEQDESRPVSPAVLLNTFLKMNLKQLQCQCQSEKLEKQKALLFTLISEYTQEIEKTRHTIGRNEQLQILKINLMKQLKITRDERGLQDESLAKELESLRIGPIQMRNGQGVYYELQEVRSKNVKLGIRVRQLQDYLDQIEGRNKKLQKDRKFLVGVDLNKQTVAYSDSQNWRGKMNEVRTKQDDFMRELKTRVRERQQKRWRDIHNEQMGIQERSRMRMDTVRFGSLKRWRV